MLIVKDAEIAQTGNWSTAAMSRRAKAVRLALDGMTQEELANSLGLSVSAVKSWESTKSSSGIRSSHIAALSSKAGIRTDFILLGETSEVVIRRDFWQSVREALLKLQAAHPS